MTMQVRCDLCGALVLDDVTGVLAEHIPTLQVHRQTCRPDNPPDDLAEFLRHFRIVRDDD